MHLDFSLAAAPPLAPTTDGHFHRLQSQCPLPPPIQRPLRGVAFPALAGCPHSPGSWSLTRPTPPLRLVAPSSLPLTHPPPQAERPLRVSSGRRSQKPFPLQRSQPPQPPLLSKSPPGFQSLPILSSPAAPPRRAPSSISPSPPPQTALPNHSPVRLPFRVDHFLSPVPLPYCSPSLSLLLLPTPHLRHLQEDILELRFLLRPPSRLLRDPACRFGSA